MRRAERKPKSLIVSSGFARFLGNEPLLILGPPGSGKTALSINIAQQAASHVCRLDLGSDDRELEYLKSRLKAEFLREFPNFQELDALTPLDSWLKFTQNGVCVILDEFESVVGCADVESFVSNLIKDAPQHCKYIIVSQIEPNLDSSVLGRLTVAEGEDLNLQADKIQALFSTKYGKTISLEIAEKLREMTRGWVTGVQFFARDLSLDIFPKDLYKYFKAIFDKQPESIQRFLLKTVDFETLDVTSCQEVLGDGDWENLIKYLARYHLFVFELESDWLKPPKIKYWPLFQIFLQLLVKNLPQIAKQCIQEEAFSQAFKIYKQLDNMEGIADLIEVAGLYLRRTGKQRELLNWINALPQALLESRDRIVSLKGIIESNLGRPANGLKLQNRVVPRFREGNHLDDLTKALVWRAITHYLLGNYEASLADTDEVLAITKDRQGFELVFAEACHIKGLALYYSNRASESMDWLMKSFELYKKAGSDYWVAILAQDIGTIYTNIGNCKEQAEHYYKIALAYWQSVNNEYRIAAVLNDLGTLYFLNGDYVEAVKCLDKAVILSRNSGYPRAESAALAGLGDTYTRLTEFDIAKTLYNSAHKIALQATDNFLIVYTKAAELMLACQEKDLRQARIKVNELGKLKLNSRYEHGLSKLAFGHKAFAEKDMAKAASLLKEAIELLSPTCQAAPLDEAKLMLSLANFSQKKDFDFDDSKINPAIIPVAQHYKHLIKKMDLPNLLTEVAVADSKQPDTRKKVSKIETIVQREESHLELCIFRDARVFLNGELIRELVGYPLLLLYILIGKWSGLTLDEICVLFWPEESKAEGKAQEVLKILRRVLPKDTIVLRNGHYCFNSIDYKYDLETYWASVSEAEKHPANSSRQIQLYEQAAGMYDVPADKITAFWTLTKKEELTNSIKDILSKLVAHHLEQGQVSCARKFCEQAVRVNPLDEDVCQMAMRFYKGLGYEVTAIRLFRRYKALLQEEMGLLPSPEITQLFETLVGHHLIKKDEK